MQARAFDLFVHTSAATFDYFKITFNNNYFVDGRMAVLKKAAARIFAFLYIFVNFTVNPCYVKSLLMIHYLTVQCVIVKVKDLLISIT